MPWAIAIAYAVWSLSDLSVDWARVAQGLPRANPDTVRAAPDGLHPAPGMVAQCYEALGGKVRYHGKPHCEIYRACLAALGAIAPGKIVAVGGSLAHDIAGAASAGVPSAFIAGGIHAAELGISHGQTPSGEALAALFASATARPHFVVPAFVW